MGEKDGSNGLPPIHETVSRKNSLIRLLRNVCGKVLGKGTKIPDLAQAKSDSGTLEAVN